jgi:O-antigen/teichoic acid export membrane protein
MIKVRITRTFLIMVFVATAQFIGTVLLARSLSRADMGFYRLVLTIIDLGVLLGVLGMDASLVRFFSSQGAIFSRFDWKSFVRGFFPWSLLLMIGVALAAHFAYRFPPLVTLGIIATMTLLLSLALHSSLLRAAHKYERAVFVSRLHLIISFACIAILYALKLLSVPAALLAYVGAAGIAGLVTYAHTRAALSSGSERLPASVVRNGLFYFGIAASLVVIAQAGPLLIARVLSLRELALFSVIASFLRLFEFVQDSSFYVLTPHLNAAKDVRMYRLLAKLLACGAGITALYLAVSKPLVHLLFNGIYDDGVRLVPWFCAVSTVKILCVLPSSIIGGLSSERILRRQCAVYILCSLLHVALTFVFVAGYGITGALAAMLVTWLTILASTLYGTRKYLAQT